MEEIWKDIKGYKNIYQVSNFGRVKSLSRLVSFKINHKRTTKTKILKQGITTGGYNHVILCDDGIRKPFRVHTLVAMAFLNHTPKGMIRVINHKDFNKNNNKLNNLEVVSNRENANKKHIESSSIYVGVSWNKNGRKWTSKIRIGTKQVYLGCFNNEYDAHLAYQNELKKIKQ